MTICEV